MNINTSNFANITAHIDDNLLINPVISFRWYPYAINYRYFQTDNYFSELDTEEKREKARTNLGIITDIKKFEERINSASLFDSFKAIPRNNTVEIEYKNLADAISTINIPSATTESAGVMSATDKKKLDNLVVEGTNVNLNTYYSDGVYVFNHKKLTNVPILNDSVVSARLTVLTAYDGTSPVITQVLNLNNLGGGEGSIYIRSYQNGEWKVWGKLQTNIEVGQVNTLDHFIDNGIYSGVLTDGTPTSVGSYYDTFVLIVINNYAVSKPLGQIQGISQLKYSLSLDRGVSVNYRVRNNDGTWNDWQEIGGASLSEATTENTGAVKLGKSNNGGWLPIGNINPSYGSGLGLQIDSAVFTNIAAGQNGLGLLLGAGSGLKIEEGIRINLGTMLNGSLHNAIPLCIGTPANLEYFQQFIGKGKKPNEVPIIPVNPNQFKLGNYGLELVNPSSTTKVTWDSNSNMNDFKTPGVYDIYGERTNSNDNLPINNASSGHSIAARLTVVASTLQPNQVEICVTQFLQLSNRVGGDGATYVRTYNENNNGMNGWSAWQKQMGMVETLINSNNTTVGQEIFSSTATKIGNGLNGMIDNGMYSGIYIDNLSYAGNDLYYLSAQPTFVETFVLVVINDYAASGKLNLPRHITQLKYAVDAITGQSTVKKRVGTGNDAISWSDWEDIGGSEVDITAIYNTIQQNTVKMNSEIDKIKNGDTIAGQAREIHSRNGKTVTDSFLARTTAGSGTIGDGVATLKQIGGNIVKNLQSINNADNPYSGSGTLKKENGMLVLTRISNGAMGARFTTNYIVGHTYYCFYVVRSSIDGEIRISISNSTSIQSVSAGWNFVSHRAAYATENTSQRYLLLSSDNNIEKLVVSNCVFIDLTEMYGAGNEPTKEECDRLFGTMDALPQGLSIAKPTEFKSIGFNQFNPDNVLEGKAIADNAIVSGDKKIAVIPCLPCKVGTGENNGYCIHGEFGEDIKVYLTPLNPMEVEGELYMHELTKDATTDTYVPQIKGYMLVEVPTTANLCAHFLWSEDKCERDSYEPYFESKVELPDIPQISEWGLAGIQSSGTLACDTIDLDRMVYIKRIGCFDGGSISWTYNETYKGFTNSAWELKGYPRNSSPYVTNKYPYVGSYDKVTDKTMGYIYDTRVFIKDSSYGTDVTAFQASLQGVMFYYELSKPEEYPLPKVDNNYISSDYGVEQFNSVVPCNANNLYYMRSLAGETRNFLDRLYDNADKTDAKEVADYITNGIENNKELATNAPNLALRALFVAAGAEYNDTGADITKTAPWGETVTHKAGHYYLNGLGDITEEEMMGIYSAGKVNSITSVALYRNLSLRTNLVTTLSGGEGKALSFYYLCNSARKIQVFNNTSHYITTVSSIHAAFAYCGSLKYIIPIINVSSVTSTTEMNKAFDNCNSLILCKIKNLKYSLSFLSSPLISKESILHTIQNSQPTTAITITLHADAYARLAEDADIVSALEAQPLITLVSA